MSVDNIKDAFMWFPIIVCLPSLMAYYLMHALKIIREQTSQGFSLLGASGAVILDVLWVIYGTLYCDIFYVISNIVMLCGAIFMFSAVVKYRPKNKKEEKDISTQIQFQNTRNEDDNLYATQEAA